tara:strand:+ start:31 stop:627 length:597 start_codon:yes stop_codon:yes gene_type:complete
MATTINGSTGASQIQDNTVSNAKVVDDAIGIAELSATGTASSSTFLRGDNAWAAPAGGGLTLLQTVNTTSGTTVTSPTLDLSTYKMLIVDVYSVGPAVNGGYLQFTPNGGTTTYYVDASVSTTQGFYAIVTHDLTSGNWTTAITTALGGRNDTARVGNGPNANQGVNTGLSTSTTSIAWSWSNGVAFNVGVIRIYGLK